MIHHPVTLIISEHFSLILPTWDGVLALFMEGYQ